MRKEIRISNKNLEKKWEKIKKVMCKHGYSVEARTEEINTICKGLTRGDRFLLQCMIITFGEGMAHAQGIFLEGMSGKYLLKILTDIEKLEKKSYVRSQLEKKAKSRTSKKRNHN